MMKDWSSPVYVFFEEPTVDCVDGCRAHVFKCSGHGCKASIRRFIDTKDAGSTGNMRKHVRACWGADALRTADSAKDIDEVHNKIVQSFHRNSKITTAFEHKTNRKATYANILHTRLEIRCVDARVIATCS